MPQKFRTDQYVKVCDGKPHQGRIGLILFVTNYILSEAGLAEPDSAFVAFHDGYYHTYKFSELIKSSEKKYYKALRNIRTAHLGLRPVAGNTN